MNFAIGRPAIRQRLFTSLLISIVCWSLGCGTGVKSADTSGDSTGTELAPVETQDIVDLVDPFIGSAGRGGWWAGNVFVGATTPFGMVQAGPDSSSPDELIAWAWNHCSGYHAEDTHIDAFSHTHLHGTGIPDLGVIGFMPIAGKITEETLKTGYASTFQDAEASPGYFSVVLDEPQVRVELTASPRGAIHRIMGLTEDQTISILVDIGHSIPLGEVHDGGITILSSTELQGWAISTNEFSKVSGGVETYFAARLDRSSLSHGTWTDHSLHTEIMQQNGADVGAWFEVEISTEEPVELKVAISYSSVEQAWKNLEAELAGETFYTVHEQATKAWNEAMSAVRFEGASEERQIIMATSLYHTLLMPNLFSDVDGSYRGFDGEIHQTNGSYDYYTNFSLWDTYRITHPLLTLIAPDNQRDMIHSLVKMAEQGGYLPRWPLAAGYSNVMIGSGADVVIADTYLKGITDIDIDNAYDAILRSADQVVPEEHIYDGRVGLAEYLALGYVPDDVVHESVSRTLEFSINDAAISNLAAALGHTEDAERFGIRAQNYRNLWDTESGGFFRPRHANGDWLEDFNPDSVIPPMLGGAYTEGSALHYVWLVPHDMEGLMELMGSPQILVSRLESFFQGAVDEHDALPPFESQENFWWSFNYPGHYWHGNEPDIHAAYLFLQAGRPDRTQWWLRWIADTLYNTSDTGIPGNDDAGTLGAWYVFTAMGFYPVAGSQQYLIGAPLFPRIDLHLSGGVLQVEAVDLSDENVYVQSVHLNGILLSKPWFTHADIAQGGVLRFQMGPKASSWGVDVFDTNDD
ncbi:MAG: hypothetical protein CMH54_13970 [Myxococcales bacterium]|nr:hypothetical protein [Myxococcales bacterium]